MLEHYIMAGGKRLRCGYTTGSCAAMAAQAATELLLTGQPVLTASLVTPKGIVVSADVLDAALDDGTARCAVRKDGGDDADVTDGALIYAAVTRTFEPGVPIDGGAGIGRVTRKGLDQPVGAAAINRVPRQMIEEQVLAVCRRHGYTGGISVVVSAPDGDRLAARTFNPRLGIRGGISILGTSGIVEPQSLQALIETVHVEMKVLAAAGHTTMILTPGNYGAAFLSGHAVMGIPHVKCSNFIGDALDFAVELGFRRLYLVGHVGKYVKLAAGIMNTHSRYGDGRVEVFAAHAAMAGASAETAKGLMAAVTADECVSMLDEAGLREPVMATILERLLYHVGQRVGDGIEVDAMLFSNEYGVLAASPGMEEIRRA